MTGTDWARGFDGMMIMLKDGDSDEEEQKSKNVRGILH